MDVPPSEIGKAQDRGIHKGGKLRRGVGFICLCGLSFFGWVFCIGLKNGDSRWGCNPVCIGALTIRVTLCKPSAAIAADGGSFFFRSLGFFPVFLVQLSTDFTIAKNQKKPEKNEQKSTLSSRRFACKMSRRVSSNRHTSDKAGLRAEAEIRAIIFALQTGFTRISGQTDFTPM